MLSPACRNRSTRIERPDALRTIRGVAEYEVHVRGEAEAVRLAEVGKIGGQQPSQPAEVTQQALGDIETRETRESDVEDDDIRAKLAAQSQGTLAVGLSGPAQDNE